MQQYLEKAIHAPKPAIGTAWDRCGTELPRGATECCDADICEAIRANPARPDRSKARAKAWAGLMENAVVWLGEEYYRAAQPSVLEVEGHQLGAYMMQEGRHTRTEEHDVWILSHPQADQLIAEWEIQLLRRHKGSLKWSPGSADGAPPTWLGKQ